MTQEYTPVTWQDETTSQQGTLINAERLNQMQTAHHYADGFEEVDAVPTADPGVSYHKVVYCTADSTFYRWDGTEWSADIDDDTKRLLEQEISRATAAEGELAQDLADETTARETADTALGTRITAETSARTAADTALGGRIDAEATAREGADTTLQEHIDTLAQQTEDALDTKVDKDGAVTSVQGHTGAVMLNSAEIPLNAGASTPTVHNAILANQGQIDAVTADLADEVQARTTAVEALSTRVDTLESAVADTYNKSQVDTYLAAKADSTALTTLSTRVDTLDAQNVKLTGPQTIRGLKTFIERIINKASGGYWLENTAIDWTVTPETNSYQFINDAFDKNNVEMFKQVISDTTTYRGLDFVLAYYNTSNVRKESILRVDAERTSDVATLRYYNGAVWSEVATVATLDSYAPMVRTTGNQTKSGELTLINNLRPLSFIINNNGDNRIPATNKNFQIEVDGAEGFTHYISFRSNTDGSRSLIHTIYSESGTNAYFNLEVAADGTRYIATNFPKPANW